MQIDPLLRSFLGIKRQICKADDLETLHDSFYIPRRSFFCMTEKNKKESFRKVQNFLF